MFHIDSAKLKEMSKDEKLDLYRMLKDVKHTQALRKNEIYLENAHLGQIRFHKAKNPIRIFLGGNRSGKSTGGANETYWRASGKHPFRTLRTPIKICIVAQDFTTHVKDVIEPKIKEWFPPGFITKVDTNHAKAWAKIYCENGTTIDIKTHDQDIKVFEGSDYDFIWYDEPPPLAIFIALWRGLTDREGECVITGTPIVEPWMYDKVCEADAEEMKGDVWYQYVNTYDNAKNLGEGDEEVGRRRIERFEKMLDEDERMARIEGKFLAMKGLIFKTWNRKTHRIPKFKWPNHWPIVYSVDPHPRKPWAVSFVGITENKNKILLHSELVDGVISDVAARCIEIAREELEIVDSSQKPRITAGWIDNYASADLMETKREGKKVKIIEEFNDEVHPFLPRVRPAPKNVSQKIDIFKEWLKVRKNRFGELPSFMVLDIPANKRFIYEIEHFRWATYTGKNKNELKDQPIKKDDDILDTVMQLGLVLGKGRVDAEFEKKKPIKYA